MRTLTITATFEIVPCKIKRYKGFLCRISIRGHHYSEIADTPLKALFAAMKVRADADATWAKLLQEAFPQCEKL